MAPPDRCRQSDLLGAKAPPGAQDGRSGANVLARPAAIGAALDGAIQNYVIAVGPTVFNHEHGIGTGGEGTTGKDLQRLARPRGAPEGMAGGDARRNGKAGLAGGLQVVVEDGIAVDGGVVVARYVAGRDDIFGQNAAQGLAQGDVFAARRRRHPIGQQGQGAVDRHPLAVGREGVRFRHCPRLP